MTEPEDLKITWSELAALARSLPASERSQLSAAFRTFAHDLSQHLGQVHSAQELLSRLLQSNGSPAEIAEMLEIIQVANSQSRKLLREFVAGWVEGLADEGRGDT